MGNRGRSPRRRRGRSPHQAQVRWHTRLLLPTAAKGFVPVILGFGVVGIDGYIIQSMVSGINVLQVMEVQAVHYKRVRFVSLAFLAYVDIMTNANVQTDLKVAEVMKRDAYFVVEDSQKPKVTRCTTKLINLERSTQKEQYRYVADSSSPDISEPDVMWSNQKDFNFINIYFEGQYESPEIVTTPDYIRYYKFGVTRGSVKIEHTKIPRRGKPPPDIKPLSFPCENSPGTKNPETETFKCNITRSDYTTSFESGDNLTVSVFIYNGGYRNIIQPHNIDTQDYIGQYQKKSMIFKFDFGKPYYSTTAANQTLFLYVSEEITKSISMPFTNELKKILTIISTTLTIEQTLEHRRAPSKLEAGSGAREE
ncbi:hypothetical protein FSP39_004348 [Pinctada imbricata]|uniref:Uncharacterized protein n=1 Tax=Pinctada imbricata TaxID=66713 RepID=A0AA88XW16_PINIB|nr:hypothetical protein FSP39_004348 [Pinctada imbricata]